MKRDFSTEVGLIAIWNADSFSDIDTAEKYRENFVYDKNMLALMNEGKLVVWGTGGDGSFTTTVRINPEHDLTEEEIPFVEMKSLGLKFIVASGKVIIGTPEGVSFMEEKYLQDNYTALVEGLVPGKYLVNLYFLYHDEPIELEKQEYADRLKIDPDFDKNGHIIVFKKVSDDYNFPEIKELPQLG